MSRPAPDDVVIRLDKMTLYTHHGVGDDEQAVGQRMIFDVEMRPVAVMATESDQVEGTVDYGEVALRVESMATGRRYRTLERLVTVIAEDLLAQFDLESVRVRATKPVPPVPITMAGASVEVLRKRNRDG